MTDLAFNKTAFYYATFGAESEITVTEDSETYYTGESAETYSNPVLFRANISPARGNASFEQYGLLKSYDKTIMTCDLSLPIDELSVLWIDTPPIIDETGATETPYDYRVVGISKSLNSATYYVKKVDVA